MVHIGFMKTVPSCLKLFANEEDYKFKQALKIETPKNRVNKNLDSCKSKSKCEVGDGVEYLNHYDIKTVKKSHGGWGPDSHRLLLNHLRENKSFMQKRCCEEAMINMSGFNRRSGSP
nr:DNA-directed RNA polymerase II subunit 1 [Tanacetum cinerariifolium]